MMFDEATSENEWQADGGSVQVALKLHSSV